MRQDCQGSNIHRTLTATRLMSWPLKVRVDGRCNSVLAAKLYSPRNRTRVGDISRKDWHISAQDDVGWSWVQPTHNWMTISEPPRIVILQLTESQRKFGDFTNRQSLWNMRVRARFVRISCRFSACGIAAWGMHGIAGCSGARMGRSRHAAYIRSMSRRS